MKTLSAFCLLISAFSICAQTKETITVSVVEIPVMIVGRDGNPIRGLTAANFEVIDDGKKRPVTSFDSIDFATANIAQAISPLNPAARRNFMLLFDLTFSKPRSVQRAQEAARIFMAKSVQPRDRVAVATLDIDRGFRLLTAFTTDRQLIAQAIDDPHAFKSSDPLQLAGFTPVVAFEHQVSVKGKEGNIQPDGASRQDALKTEAAEELTELAMTARTHDDEFNRERIDRAINTLGALSSVMKSIAGRKQVVFLSEGFDPSLVSGRDAHVSQEAVEELSKNIDKNEAYRIDTDKKFGNSASLKLITVLSETCKRADVVLHAIDIKGIRVDNSTQDGLSRTSNEGLHLVADATGGTVFKNTNDITEAFNRMLHQQEVVYVLGINGNAGNPGQFHALKVKLVNVPGNPRVSARSGYFEVGAETEAERTLTTAEIIVNDIPQYDLRIATVAAAFPGTGDKAQVPVIVDINGVDLLAKSDDEVVTADVYIYAFDATGLVRDALYQRITLDANKVGDKLRAGGVKYYGTLSLPPATYAIKTLVRLPEQQKNGFARAEIVVPAPNAIAMSRPLFFEDTSQWVLVRGASHDASGAYPFTIGESTFVPSASAHRRFAVFVANANDANVDVNPAASLVSKDANAFVFDLAPDSKSPTLEIALRGTSIKSSVPLR